MNTDEHSTNRPLRQLTETISTDLSSARSAAMDLEQQLQAFVQERPVVAVLTALGVGYVLARVFARR